MCIKSDFEEIILKLATYRQREKAFLLSSKFCPQWIVCPCLGLYIYMVKHEKNVYKIGLQSNFFKPAKNGQSIKGFLLTSKVCPQGVVCPCPGAIYIYKIIKNVFKIRFRRDHFETCNIWAKRKGFSVVIKILSPMLSALPRAICMWKNMKKRV